ncbi:MAG: methenyltetrahydromethanopterin cyclohydrolase [Planctomycetota bacterium]
MELLDQLNARALAVCEVAEKAKEPLDIKIEMTANGGKILDFGSDRKGTVDAGLLLARICMADLADVTETPSPITDFTLPFIQVETDQPLLACIGSQYAGWPFSTEHLFSMCSGPARLNRGREEILSAYDLEGTEDQVVGILESNRLPNADDMTEFASQCGCSPEQITHCVARTSSLPGSIQVVARSVETSLHKLFELGVDLRSVKRGKGNAPIPPVGDDDYQSMGWTNDAILYGATVELWLDELTVLESKVESIPSNSSSEFGRPFIEIFEEFDRDFYKVDRMLFSPARVKLHCLKTGNTVAAGELRTDILEESFRVEKR